MIRELQTAQHEAAHIVVGSALGLRLKRAVLAVEPISQGWVSLGGTWFDGRVGTAEAWSLMLAAGVAWELAVTGNTRGARGDIAILRAMHIHTRPRVRALALAAGAILETRGAIHARVTRALLERDLNHADLQVFILGAE